GESGCKPAEEAFRLRAALGQQSRGSGAVPPLQRLGSMNGTRIAACGIALHQQRDDRQKYRPQALDFMPGTDRARSVRLEVFIDGGELRKITAAVPVSLIVTTFAQKTSDEPRYAASEILLVGALGETIANQRCDDDAGEDRSEAVGAEMEDEVRMLRVEQRHHRRRISGEYRTVGDDTAMQVA